VARGDADLEGVAEAPHHAQPGVVLDQPCVDARGAAGGEVGSLAESATAAAPPGRHPLRLDSAGAEGRVGCGPMAILLTAPG